MDQTREFEQLWSKAQTLLAGMARRLSPAYPDDLLQNTRIRCWQSFGNVDDTSRFTNWACRVMQRQAMDMRRLPRYQQHVSLDEALTTSTEPDMGAGTLAELLVAEAARIGEYDGVLLLQMVARGCTEREIAKRMDVQRGTVKSRRHKLRLQLLKSPTVRAYLTA